MTRLPCALFFASLIVLITSPLRLSAEKSKLVLQEEFRAGVAQALVKAGSNSNELRKALEEVAPEMRKGMQFLIANMPDRDLKVLNADFLLNNVRLAYQTRELPWAKNLDDDLFLNDVLPYASIDEKREDWRGDFYKQFLPVVKGCATPGEAAHKLNQEVFKMVGVKYSTKRNKANQSPSESMEIGMASCTGLSVILTDACRAVGVPARLAGTPLWMNKRGNHTWVEVWDGTWKVAGAAEPSGKGLDHGWFLGQASQADDTQWQHRIYATSFKKTGIHFPMVWDRRDHGVPAVNVTNSYKRFGNPKPKAALPDAAGTVKKNAGVEQVTLMIQMLDRPGGKRVETKVSVRSQGKSLGEGSTPKPTHDANRFLEIVVPRDLEVKLSYRDKDGKAQSRVWKWDEAKKQAGAVRQESQVDLYLSE